VLHLPPGERERGTLIHFPKGKKCAAAGLISHDPIFFSFPFRKCILLFLSIISLFFQEQTGIIPEISNQPDSSGTLT